MTTHKGNISKQRIIEAANQLIYTQGYNQTSFADVAENVGITKGNLHYHYRSKDELFDAVIAFRMDLISAGLAQWDTEFPDAKSKLKRFVQMMRNEAENVVRYGCPMGTLNVELGKCQPELRARSREMFDLFRHWLEKAFKQLGIKHNRQLADHLLSMSQGAVLMCYVYEDTKLLQNECKRIDAWIDSL